MHIRAFLLTVFLSLMVSFGDRGFDRESLLSRLALIFITFKGKQGENLKERQQVSLVISFLKAGSEIQFSFKAFATCDRIFI